MVSRFILFKEKIQKQMLYIIWQRGRKTQEIEEYKVLVFILLITPLYFVIIERDYQKEPF